MVKQILFIFMVGACSVPAYALKYSDYMKLMRGDETQQFAAKYYVKGAADALLFANGYLDSMNLNTVYCQPKKLAIGPETYLNILEDEIKMTSNVAQVDYPVSLLLLWGLQRVLPCKK
jgi:hypothetical protein